MVLRMIVLICGLVSMPAYSMSGLLDCWGLWRSRSAFTDDSLKYSYEKTALAYRQACYVGKGDPEKLADLLDDECELTCSTSNSRDVQTFFGKGPVMEQFQAVWFTGVERAPAGTRVLAINDSKATLIHAITEDMPNGDQFAFSDKVELGFNRQGKISSITLALLSRTWNCNFNSGARK